MSFDWLSGFKAAVGGSKNTDSWLGGYDAGTMLKNKPSGCFPVVCMIVLTTVWLWAATRKEFVSHRQSVLCQSRGGVLVQNADTRDTTRFLCLVTTSRVSEAER